MPDTYVHQRWLLFFPFAFGAAGTSLEINECAGRIHKYRWNILEPYLYLLSQREENRKGSRSWRSDVSCPTFDFLPTKIYIDPTLLRKKLWVRILVWNNSLDNLKLTNIRLSIIYGIKKFLCRVSNYPKSCWFESHFIPKKYFLHF